MVYTVLVLRTVHRRLNRHMLLSFLSQKSCGVSALIQSKLVFFYCCCRCMESMFQLMTPSIFRCSKTRYCAFLEFKFKRHLFYDLILLTKPARDTTLLSVAFPKEMFDDGRSFKWLRKYCFTVFWCPSTGMRCLNIKYFWCNTASWTAISYDP